MKHSIVFHEKGRFGGWPANNGLWSWGDEILVSYVVGGFDPKSDDHSIDYSQEMLKGFSRSTDGGETWTVEPAQHNFADECLPVPDGGFDFTAPGFALRVGNASVSIHGRAYTVSYDRGHSWTGPYALPDFGRHLTCRTCYLIENSKTMRIFMSYKADPGKDKHLISDRAFCAVTEDGGQSWSFLGNITDDEYRSVMPAVVKLSDGTLLCAIRRKRMIDGLEDNWIETRRSTDGGRSWGCAVRAAETGEANGNPPALALLCDGRAVLVYGNRRRGAASSIRAAVSDDGGISWKNEIILRDDSRTWDLGYPRLAVRPDSGLVAVYYYNSNEFAEQYIASTLFYI